MTILNALASLWFSKYCAFLRQNIYLILQGLPLSKNKHNNSMIAVLPLDSLHTFTLYLIAITSTGIIVVI